MDLHIDDMNKCVLEETQVMSKAENKFNRNTEMHGVAKKMCDTFEAEWNTASEQRKEEMDLLRIIRTMANERMAQYRDANQESKYHDNYGESYEDMQYNEG